MKKSNSFFTTFRGSLTELSIIARFFLSKGVIPRSRSELLDYAVKSTVQSLTNQQPELNVTTTEDALQVLSQLGLVDKGNREVFNILLAENQNRTASEIIDTRQEEDLNKTALNDRNSTLAKEATELLMKAQQKQQEDRQKAKDLFSSAKNISTCEEEENE